MLRRALGGSSQPLFSNALWMECQDLPNLPDEGDNHLIELALAGGAQAIVTHNLRDLRGGGLQLGTLRVLTPAQCLEEWK